MRATKSAAQQRRQLGDIRRNPSRFILAEQLGSGSPARLILEIDIREFLPCSAKSMKAWSGTIAS
jgi:hypothetical protein